MSFLTQFDFFKAKLIEKLNESIETNKNKTNKKNINKENNKITNYFEKIITKANENYADYAFHTLALAKFTKDINSLQNKIIEKFKNDDIFKVEKVNKYFNFIIKTEVLSKYVLNSILLEKENFGKINLGKNQTIVIEYSSPNIAKPFGIGHLRSTVIGDALRRIYSYLGFNVIGINYLGDYGTQFGKMIYAFKNLAGKNKEELLRKNGTNYLVELYVKYHKEEEKNPELTDFAREEFKKLENGDKENLKLWNKFKKISLDEFKKIYDDLNIKFDKYEFESEAAKEVNKIINKLRKKKLLIQSEGASIVDLEKFKLGKAIIIKSNGTSIYLSRDLAALENRKKRYNFKKILYVVGSEQKRHFKQLFKISELLEIIGEKEHVDFGLYQIKNEKMSTRKGKVIFMSDVIKRVINKAEEIIRYKKTIDEKEIKNSAKKLAISAIKFNDLSQDRIKNITFDWDEMLRFDGETSAYVNYSFVRAKGIIKKLNKYEINTQKQYSSFNTKIERKLIKKMYDYPSIILSAMNKNKPHIIAYYLITLAKTFNEFYREINVMRSKEKNEKLALVKAYTYIIQSGFKILGLPYVQKM